MRFFLTMTGLILIFGLKSFGQVHIDTVKIVKRMDWRFESRNGVIYSVQVPRYDQDYDLKVGLNKIYRESGNLLFIGTYKMDKDSNLFEDGAFIKYTESGIVKDTGSYHDGKKVGIWSYFDASGTVEYE